MGISPAEAIVLALVVAAQVTVVAVIVRYVLKRRSGGS